MLFTLAIGLILAWKVAGYYGLDRYVLPMLGTPWHPGPVSRPREPLPSGSPRQLRSRSRATRREPNSTPASSQTTRGSFDIRPVGSGGS